MLIVLATGAAQGQKPADVKASYPAYQFDPAEGWHAYANGPGGTSGLTRRALRLDFSRGATSVSLKVPDRSLLTRPETLRLRVRGSAKGHPLEVSMRTHFMRQDMEDVAKKARDAGVKWSREDFSWSRIEPQPGKFVWDYYDALLDCANRYGITVYAIVGYWAPWSKQYTSEGVDQYVAYLRQLVRRYKGRINQWEIWNEPNIFFWQGPKELYAEMLKKSYAAIKEEDPAAQVLGISTAGIDRAFIDKMLKLGTPFDVLAIWNAKADATAELKVPAGRVKIVNSMDEIVEQNAADGAVKVNLQAGAAMYVISE